MFIASKYWVHETRGLNFNRSVNDNLITFKNVSKQYPDGTTAVKNINLEIKEGEFFVLIGPSGCGKTTTLKMINRLHDITEGELYHKR